MLASPHRDYPNLVRVSCLKSRRIKTWKAGEEATAVPGSWIRQHLCGGCTYNRSTGVTPAAAAAADPVTPPEQLPLGAA